MTQVNMFEIAARKKLRFESTKGDLTAEQLWEAPLRGASGFNLDQIARAADRKVKSLTEESFVENRSSKASIRAELCLDIIKYVIETRLAEDEAKLARADKLKQKEKIVTILAEKEDDDLKKMTTKQLKEKMASLEA